MKPMLARAQASLPSGNYLYEPKWDGFRCIVFRDGAKLVLQSRNARPLNRYFPELCEGLPRVLPARCTLDGELVIAGPHGLDFEGLLQRIHPAASRVAMLAGSFPATLVAFDLLRLGARDLTALPFSERRALLEKHVPEKKPVTLSPITSRLSKARRWFDEFERRGFDGVVAKDPALPYLENQRVMIKVKHQRTADCVVGGYRAGKDGKGLASLLLGLYDDQGTLQHVGVAASMGLAERKKLEALLAPLAKKAAAHPEDHPWSHGDPEAQRIPGAASRWNAKADLGFTAVQPKLAVEVAYDHMQGDRFRHTTHLVRLRADRDARSCTYAQLEKPKAARPRRSKAPSQSKTPRRSKA